MQGLLFDLEPPAAGDAPGPLVRRTREGLYLPEADLWLDPLTAQPAAVISHAHSDHARAVHGWALATAATHDFMAERGRACPGPRVAYGEPVERNGCKLTLASAGHVLGSAQVIVDTPRGRLVYTGDCKLRASRTAGPPAEPIPCDTLIIEATFALPIFRFPPTAELESRIVALARAALADGETPVFLGYSLGKGPELVKILADAGVPVRPWGTIRRLLPIYQRHGVDFSAVPMEAPGERGDAMPAAVVIPPSARVHPGIEKLRDRQVIYVSGWAALDASYDRMDADHLVPLSDHFDWPQTWQYIEAARSRRVLATHGYTEPLVRALQSRGWAAEAVNVGYGGGDDDPEPAG